MIPLTGPLSSIAKMSQKVAEFLAKQQQLMGDSSQAPYWIAFDELYNKKLWHQLTLKLLEFIREEKPQNLLEIYDNFISDFEIRINQLSLVEIAVYVVKQIPTVDAKFEFIEKIKGSLYGGNSHVHGSIDS